jgi:hypothetical protein
MLEANNMAKYPREISKKKEPAAPWPTPRSFSIVGRRGESAIRERKFKKKITARLRIGPNDEEKGFGVVSVCGTCET